MSDALNDETTENASAAGRLAAAGSTAPEGMELSVMNMGIDPSSGYHEHRLIWTDLGEAAQDWTVQVFLPPNAPAQVREEALRLQAEALRFQLAHCQVNGGLNGTERAVGFTDELSEVGVTGPHGRSDVHSRPHSEIVGGEPEVGRELSGRDDALELDLGAGPLNTVLGVGSAGSPEADSLVNPMAEHRQGG